MYHTVGWTETQTTAASKWKSNSHRVEQSFSHLLLHNVRLCFVFGVSTVKNKVSVSSSRAEHQSSVLIGSASDRARPKASCHPVSQVVQQNQID